MTKVKLPDRNFIYISPLKNIEIQIDFARCQVEQIYKHADKFMKGQS